MAAARSTFTRISRRHPSAEFPPDVELTDDASLSADTPPVIELRDEETAEEIADSAHRQPSLPEVRFPKWQRAIRPRAPQYPLSRIQRAGGPRQVVPKVRERIQPPIEPNRARMREPFQARQVRWHNTGPLPSVEPVEFRHEEKRDHTDAGESLWASAASELPVEPGLASKPASLYSSSPAQSELKWPELPASAGMNVSVKHPDGTQYFPAAAEFAGTASPALEPSSEWSESAPQPLDRGSVHWHESSESRWPDLPQETVFNEDAEIRVARALERRMRLDSEQGGMTWSVRLF
jgi:hypothetical protein